MSYTCLSRGESNLVPCWQRFCKQEIYQASILIHRKVWGGGRRHADLVISNFIKQPRNSTWFDNVASIWRKKNSENGSPCYYSNSPTSFQLSPPCFSLTIIKLWNNQLDLWLSPKIFNRFVSPETLFFYVHIYSNTHQNYWHLLRVWQILIQNISTCCRDQALRGRQLLSTVRG